MFSDVVVCESLMAFKHCGTNFLISLFTILQSTIVLPTEQ